MDKLHKWHQRRPGRLAFAVADLAITYGFASLAIDRGNLWWYILVLIFLIGSLQNVIELLGSFLRHGRSHARPGKTS